MCLLLLLSCGPENLKSADEPSQNVQPQVTENKSPEKWNIDGTYLISSEAFDAPFIFAVQFQNDAFYVQTADYPEPGSQADWNIDIQGHTAVDDSLTIKLQQPATVRIHLQPDYTSWQLEVDNEFVATAVERIVLSELYTLINKSKSDTYSYSAVIQKMSLFEGEGYLICESMEGGELSFYIDLANMATIADYLTDDYQLNAQYIGGSFRIKAETKEIEDPRGELIEVSYITECHAE